ncbi:MAG: hypothetical protein RMJ37_03635 [Spirochaetia bacterium]|nr:hypothetical protein [Spirochaetota bacterium]MDW8112420.1 hypothetical protein [Spirochaetia bacterium]
MIDFKKIDLNNIQIPPSILVGSVTGLLIGLTVGIVNGGALIEVIFRSLLSAIILGGVLFGIEQLLRRFASEIFEQPSRSNSVNIREEDDDISISDIYSDKSNEVEANEDMNYGITEPEYQENDNSISSSMDFSESNVFGEFSSTDEDVNIGKITDDTSNYRDEIIEGGFSSFNYEGEDKGYYKPNYQDLSSAELGVTKQSKVGVTEDFIILSKGKPIPRDPKKMAEAIRTKLKEEK